MQAEKLSLPEEFSLLALVQKTGYFEGRIFQAVEFYTAASCMMELFYRGKLVERDQKVMLLESTRTGLEYLDVMLDKITGAGRPKSLLYWFINFSNKHVRTRQRIADHLVRKEILKPVRKHVLHIFPVNNFIEIKPETREEIVKRMREKLLGYAPMDEQTLGLALLLKQARLLKRYFSSDEHSKIEDILRRLQNEGMWIRSFHLVKTISRAYKSIAAPKWESFGF